LLSFGSGVNTILAHEISGITIHRANPNEWNGGKKHISTSLFLIQTIPAAHNKSFKIFSWVNSTVFGKDSLHEVNNTTAIFEISFGILNNVALQTAANFCINETSFKTSSKNVILYFCNHGV
jgi:hypothetical protein